MIERIITIFGSTGNLMYKKLFPALDALIKKKCIDQKTKIFCIARKDCTLVDYVEDAKKGVKENLDWDSIIPFLTYIKMDVFDIDDYHMLKNRINRENKHADVMFYLAVPPVLFKPIAVGLSQSGIMKKNDEHRRILFEKPFGSNFKDANDINQTLQKLFVENQIYRIDHYLGKEMLQNIFIMRFSNSMFKNNWRKDYIKSITILVKEEETVMTRGSYYDHVGALKDMIQSHLLQMVALTTMAYPKKNQSQAIKDEKVNILKKIEIDESSILFGQYEGYLNESGIDQLSKTETFVFLKAYINDEKWQGVPIYLLTGKKLNEKRSEIIVEFESKEDIQIGWRYENVINNQLIIKIAPEEGVTLKVNVKSPGLENHIHLSELTYCHACQTTGGTPEAYEKLLLDFMHKDNTLYTRWDEIVASWQVISKLKDKPKKLVIYKSFETLKKIILTKEKDIIKDI